MGVRNPTVPTEVPADAGETVTATDPLERCEQIVHQGMQQLAWVTIVDIGAFFAVLMIGFAYVWKRGDLDWVRAVSRERGQATSRSPAQPIRSTKRSSVGLSQSLILPRLAMPSRPQSSAES